MIQKTKVKKAFNKAGLQITLGALNMIEETIKRQIAGMVSRTKENNVKRLTEDLFWTATGNYHYKDFK